MPIVYVPLAAKVGGRQREREGGMEQGAKAVSYTHLVSSATIYASSHELALLKASLEKNGVLKSCLETAALQHRANRTKG